MRTILTTLVLALVFVAGTASAHVVGAPPDRETRLLHDCVDDYFGGDVSDDKNGWDVHTLDVSERFYNGAPALVFRVVTNGNGAAEIHVRFDGPDGVTSHKFTTSGSSWSGDFEKVESTSKITRDGSQDGDRIALLGWVPYAEIGASVGDTLQDYTVEARMDGETIDSIPGDDTGLIQSCEDNAERPDYKLRGTGYYVDASLDPESASLEAGQETLVAVNLDNAFRNTAQRVTVTIDAGDLDVRLHDPETDTYKQGSLQVTIAKRAGTLVHLVAVGDVGQDGTVPVTITTDQGGHETLTFAYSVGGEPPVVTPTPDPGSGSEQDSPAGLVALAAIAVALWVRRQ